MSLAVQTAAGPYASHTTLHTDQGGLAVTPAILRQAPGEAALVAGTYALVGHYGEPLGLTQCCEKGEGLPLVAATDQLVWFVLVDKSIETAQAA
jgi:hypothetical protein